MLIRNTEKSLVIIQHECHTLDISVKKKQVMSQKRSQHSQQNYHENLGLRKTLHPPKSTRLKLP